METKNNNAANYNTDPFLWEQMPAKSMVLITDDGHVYKDQSGYIGRFSDRPEAVRVLEAAGFKNEGDCFVKH